MTAADKIMAYMPEYYQNSRIMSALVAAVGRELDCLKAAINTVLTWNYVRTADESGLAVWEKELDLPPGQAETIDERRARIISLLRGPGTATIRAIKTLAESYDKGVIDVAEDYSTYTIIRFVDTTGIPSNIEDLKKIVREIVPAHLALEYEYNYFVWDELDACNWTWDQLDLLSLTYDALEVYR